VGGASAFARRRSVPRLLGLLTAAVVVAVAAASPTLSEPAPKLTPFVPGQLIVGFDKGVSQGQQTLALANVGASKELGFRQIRASLVNVPQGQMAAVAAQLASDPHVKYVEPNHLVSIDSTIPNDPSFNQLWGLNNTGQSGGKADADIDAPEAWDVTTGSKDVTVAVVDSGVDFSHPDLAGEQWVNAGENCGSTDPTISCAQRTNGVDDDGDGYVDDWRGWDFVNGDNNPTDDNLHGTHVAGTIGARGNNGVGITGVNWNVSLMALKFINASGTGTTADAVRATLYAADHGAQVSNNSWGGPDSDQALQDAIDYGARKGTLFVAAAGNDGHNDDTTPTYPAAWPSDSLVSVAATDNKDGLASFSNYGRTAVDLGAPGVGIVSTIPGGLYFPLDGTSMAAPHVTGTAALAKSVFPDASPYALKALLLGAADPDPALAGKTVTGGRLNAASAVTCSNHAELVLDAPGDGFAVPVGTSLAIHVIAADCAEPAGVENVSVDVNGAPVTMSAASPDDALYTGSYTPTATGALTLTATVSVGGASVTRTANGTAVAAPEGPFPTLDGFDRPDESPLSDGGRWSNAIIGGGETGLKVTSSALACTKTTTCTAWWNAASLGPDTEVWATITTLPGAANSIRLNARIQQPGSTAADGYELRTIQQPGVDQVLLERIDNGSLKTLLTVNQELAVGDMLLLRVEGSTLEAWRNDGTAWSRLGGVTDATYPASGFVGVGLRGTTGRLDDFGARVIGSPSPPMAPTSPSALSGNGLARLSWQPPASDGGSPVTGYDVYRGTSPGAESLLTTLGPVTSFDDTTVTNETTYYYEVSAVNGAGEGTRSAEVSVTPTGVTPPTTPLPTLDGFDRADENPLSDAGRWSNGVAGSGESGLKVVSGTLACGKSTTCTAWRNNASYGPDTEVSGRLTTLPGTSNSIRLYARVQQPGSSALDGYMLRTVQQTGTDQVFLERIDNGSIKTLLTMNQELSVGDTLVLRVQGSTLEAWRFDGTSWWRLGTVIDSTYSTAGFVSVGLRGTMARLDDFGARTLGAPAPSQPGAPTALSASPGDSVAHLSWQAPSSDGGSAITGYVVYRGTVSGSETKLATFSNVTSYDDATAANGTTYYYEVSAVNVAGEGPVSNEASTTPTGSTPPVTPLPILDDFNRANETLSDGGRWTNGVAGSGESGLKVVSSQLSCSKSTTCTAWWNAGSFGPDSETWGTITTLPGTSNAIRLYTRVKQPGGSGIDGYMLRTNQQTGTDQVFLERLDNGAITTLLTINQELSLGDTLLFRARGSTLEAWRFDGSSWSRLGFVLDSTYPAAGYVGVGLRGMTGRLDDFGARTLS
jgi:subtilisin family serine protease